MKKIISFIVLVVFMAACTDKFESMNVNSTRISLESLEQEFNHIGTVFPSMIRYLEAEQRFESLLYESFIGQITTNTDFMGNRNNTTYFITWNTLWNQIYRNLMNPTTTILPKSDAGGYTEFSAKIRLLRVVGLSKLTSFYGPIIYSNFGSTDNLIYYDSEPEIYDNFFKTLDETMAVFAANPTFKGFTKFDNTTYEGDITKWMKFINSFRIRLAMRIVKVDPDRAELEFNKAVNDPAGLILENGNNFVAKLNAKPHIVVVFHDWTDARMGAGYEEVLVGYKDPRIRAWFTEVADEDKAFLTPGREQGWAYKGVASGSWIKSKNERQIYSNIPAAFNNVRLQRHMTAQEIHFCLAEAALRGWNTPKTVKEHYEDGIKSSFEDWGVGGVDAYLADSTSMPIDYIDPLDALLETNEQERKNSYNTRMTDPEAYTIKWIDNVSDEKKLERIMTQKWIASFNNSMEMWADHRRTGYPKVHLARKNDSSPQWGVVDNNEPFPFPKRWPFIDSERLNNKEAVADATAKLGGPDLISTSLWIHPNPGGPNF